MSREQLCLALQEKLFEGLADMITCALCGLPIATGRLADASSSRAGVDPFLRFTIVSSSPVTRRRTSQLGTMAATRTAFSTLSRVGE